MDLGKLEKFTASCTSLCGGEGIPSEIVFIIMCVCFSLFALTTLVGFVSFTEICAKRITRAKAWVFFIRIMCLFVTAFGVIVNFSGLDLSALWNLSDMANILMVYCNLPLLYIGLKYVLRAYRHYVQNFNFHYSMLQYETTNNKLARMDDKTTKKAKKILEKNSVAKKYLIEHANDD